jgi:NAD(P)-dependent dehydrogenase (short-subunit alcohol dehydrogenase family)
VEKAYEFARGGPAEDFPEHGWDKIMALNVKAIFYLTIELAYLFSQANDLDADFLLDLCHFLRRARRSIRPPESSTLHQSVES